jgi:streptogramin lyase
LIIQTNQEIDTGISFTPYKGVRKPSKQSQADHSTDAPNKVTKPSKKALGKRRISSDDVKSDLDTTWSGGYIKQELGIPPIEALAAFVDLPEQNGHSSSIRRLYAYRTVWNCWKDAIEASLRNVLNSCHSLTPIRRLLITSANQVTSMPLLFS